MISNQVYFVVYITILPGVLGVAAFVAGIGSFGCFARLSPSPLYDAKVTFCRTAGEGVRRMQSSRKNSKRKRHYVPFFPLAPSGNG